MISQLICHLIGDYILQSDWMANNKTTQSFACLCHALTYGLVFLLLKPSISAFVVIVVTHFLIDRFRLAKYVVYAKNFLAPRSETHTYYGIKTDKYKWKNCKATGYPSETPPFLAVWLLIIADNTLHLAINFLALMYL